ncbi:glycosyl transferase family 4, partial [Nanoarchaeota archaeon NZ13-N]
PLMVTSSGVSVINIPFIGPIDVGMLYPLVLVPIGIIGASNAFNMIAGYNGLEASMGLILFTSLAIKSYLSGLYYISYTSLITVSSILAFFIFNKYPARVFPGNSFTYGIGALYGSLIILGNMEKFGVITYTLYFIELILFLRGLKDGIYKENFGIPDEKNCLKEPYEKIYSMTHLAIKINKKIFGCATERKVVITLSLLQALICIVSLLT